MEEKLWNVSSSPHVRDHSSTQSIMRDVVIALLPATIIGIYNFRLSAVLVILTCCVSCMLAEYIWQRLMKQKVTTNDFSALLTGLLLALNLPATMGNPKYLWMCILGSVFAIIVVKQLFGGLGQNFMNPALGGRCFLMLSFSSVMTSFTVKEGSNCLYGISVDAASSATPLMDVKEGGYPSLLKMFWEQRQEPLVRHRQQHFCLVPFTFCSVVLSTGKSRLFTSQHLPYLTFCIW